MVTLELIALVLEFEPYRGNNLIIFAKKKKEKKVQLLTLHSVVQFDSSRLGKKDLKSSRDKMQGTNRSG